MQNRIDSTFARLRKNQQSAFVAYLTGGDPDLETSFQIAGVLAEAGVDILEIGVPFSDPLADGPTIQAAASRALSAGCTVGKLLDRLKEFRKTNDLPVVLFTYLNPVYVYGFEKFHQDAAAAGADGVLILDLPPDEAVRNRELAGAHGLHAIRLIAPTSSESRVAQIASSASGFIYYVSREGVTGEQSELSESIGGQLEVIRRHSQLPIAVGFGISTPEQAARVAGLAEGVVVGSAIVRRIAAEDRCENLPESIASFVRPLAEAIHAVRKPA